MLEGETKSATQSEVKLSASRCWSRRVMIDRMLLNNRGRLAEVKPVDFSLKNSRLNKELELMDSSSGMKCCTTVLRKKAASMS